MREAEPPEPAGARHRLWIRSTASRRAGDQALLPRGDSPLAAPALRRVGHQQIHAAIGEAFPNLVLATDHAEGARYFDE